ncbi:MAG TPA: hypothetical protein VEP49_20915, partial [Acidimicrobiia bacterium]|nr:hypothetical protein [Acidimicrobiia bacterium]
MSGRVARTARVAAVTFAVAAGVLVVTAPPAAAHGVGGVQPRNYLTKLLRITPHVPGLELTVVDLGDNLLLHNRTGREVVVLGYQGEPYLRVGPQGVFENTRSPATYLNRTRIPTTNPPKFADAAAAPVWRKVSSGSTVKWHDHRVHYMGTEDPPQVQQDPSVRHLVDRWTVQLRAGGQTVTASGELVYVPPPSPWPFAAFAVTLAAALVLLSRTRWWRAALAVGLGALVASDLAHVVGVWNATTATTTSRLGESAYSLVGIGLGV